MPVEVFFRQEQDLTSIEHLALNACTGKVLDVGAAAGALTLALQQRDLEVTALDHSVNCIEVMRKSGVKNCIQSDIWQHQATYDTLLVLMNGMGLAGTLARVPDFLQKLVSLMEPDGQILVDSSDIQYLYQQGAVKPDHYYGEVRYRYEYLGNIGDWFDWVYVDPTTMTSIVKDLDLKVKLLYTASTDQYLMRISRS